MDVGSPKHLERLRGEPAVKAALFRLDPDPAFGEARFERSSKNAAYWPPISQLAERFFAAGSVVPLTEGIRVYGRPCWLLAVPIAASPTSPFVIALASAEGPPSEALATFLREVCHDFWYGSSFFK